VAGVSELGAALSGQPEAQLGHDEAQGLEVGEDIQQLVIVRERVMILVIELVAQLALADPDRAIDTMQNLMLRIRPSDGWRSCITVAFIAHPAEYTADSQACGEPAVIAKRRAAREFAEFAAVLTEAAEKTAQP
jgi:hypothetical protein